jgi:hypothetical protein
MSINPTINVSEYFLEYLKTKMSDTINDFSEEVASSYKVDSEKIIAIWNKVCPDISIEVRKTKNETKKEDKNDAIEEIIGPDSNKVYDRNDIISLLVEMLNKNQLTKDKLKPDIDNLKSIKKLLKNKEFEVSKSIIKKILSKNSKDIMEKCELDKKFVRVEDLEEFTLEE